jgi:hypothetical protein
MSLTTCSVCKKKFQSTSFFHNTCPDCTRVAKSNEQLFEQQKELNRSRQQHERELQEEADRKSKDLQKRNERFQEEQFYKTQQLEHLKIQELNRLQDEQFYHSETSSIKDKVYKLALINPLDSESISRLIALIIKQHPDHLEFIYSNVVALGYPFDVSGKKIFTQLVREKIHEEIKGQMTFQEKACKYFMPFFSGYEYEIFSESLMVAKEFEANIGFERHLATQELKQGRESRTKEILGIESPLNELNYSINEKSQILDAEISTHESLEGWFTDNYSLLPRLGVYLGILYLIGFFVIKFNFSFLTLSIFIGVGAIINWIIVATNKRRQKRIESLKDELRIDCSTQRNLSSTLEQKRQELKEFESDKESLIQLLNEHLAYLQSRTFKA